MEPETRPELEQLFKSIRTFNTIQMSADSRDKLYRYNDALMQSLYSIIEDQDADEQTKLQYLDATMDQYAAAMRELLPKLISTQNPTGRPVVKADQNRFDNIEEVEKFNPYHDAKGRFSTADGATLFTFRTKDQNKQHMANAAIDREKDRDDKGLNGPSSKNPLGDPPTIAGVNRGKPMSREDADEGNANPNYEKGGGYRTNCQSCVVTYEARRRGYDVTTKPYAKGTDMEYLARKTHEAWIDPKTGDTPKRPERDESITTPKRCLEMIENTIKPGERYTFEHHWKGRSRSGHIVCMDRDSSGNLRLFDPQNGKTLVGSQINGYLNRVKYTTTIYGTKFNCSPRLLRVDNLAINPAHANNIMEAA